MPAPTPAPSVTPILLCNFDGGSSYSPNTCGMDYGDGTSYPWTYGSCGYYGCGTPSGYTGPSADHTTGSGNYMFVEASSNYPSVGPYTLTSPQYDACIGQVNFAYHMYGSGMGTLALEETTNGVDWTMIWNIVASTRARCEVHGHKNHKAAAEAHSLCDVTPPR